MQHLPCGLSRLPLRAVARAGEPRLQPDAAVCELQRGRKEHVRLPCGNHGARRGDSYLGKDYSEPPGLPEDVHVSKKIECVDCHETGPGGMGHIQRKAGCQDCHIEVEAGNGIKRS